MDIRMVFLADSLKISSVIAELEKIELTDSRFKVPLKFDSLPIGKKDRTFFCCRLLGGIYKQDKQ
jgi:hypothetical protein